MRTSLFFAAGMLAVSGMAVNAMPRADLAIDTGAAAPALIRVADGCGAGRFRGVGGYCEGHRPIMVRKVCTVRGYPYAAVRRCHMVRM